MSKFTFIVNPSFTSLLSEISKNAKKGRLFEEEEEKKPEDETPSEQPPTEEPSDSAPVDDKSTPSTDAASDETSEPAPDSSDTQSDVSDANAEADIAKAELEKAKSEKAAAEQELQEQGYIKLSSPSGTTALLQMIIDPAIQTNQLDSLANSLVTKLAINDPEKFKQFKDDTIGFRGIVGFNQLVQNMEKFIGQSSSITPTV